MNGRCWGKKGRSRMEEHGEGGKTNEMVILVRVKNAGFIGALSRCYEFFRVDLKRDGNTAVSPCCPPLSSDTGEGCLFCLGPFIYILNGRLIEVDDPSLESGYVSESEMNDYDKFAFQIDLNQKRPRWRQAPTPRYTRGSDNGVALCGKIYFFGPRLIPEVYDPNTNNNGHGIGSNRWVQLPPPPDDVGDSTISYPVLPDPSNHRILVHMYHYVKSSASIYAFYPGGQAGDAKRVSEWKCLTSNFNRWNEVSAFADGVIYSYQGHSRNLFGAYDLATNRWLEVVWSSPYPHPIDIDSTEYDALLYLGHGLLCLATYYPNYRSDGNKSIRDGIRTVFFIFDFKRSGDADASVITFTHRCTRSYYFPFASEAFGFFPLDPSAAVITEPKDSSMKPKPDDVIQKKGLPLQYWALPVAIVGISVVVGALYLQRK